MTIVDSPVTALGDMSAALSFPVFPQDALHYHDFQHRLEQEFAITTTAERALIEMMARALWRKRQLAQLETSLIQTQNARKRQEAIAAHKQKLESVEIQERRAEIQVLEKSIELLDDLLQAGQQINRIRTKARFQREATQWVLNAHAGLETVESQLNAFVSLQALEDACRGWPHRTGSGQFCAARCEYKIAFESRYGIEKPVDSDPSDQPRIVQLSSLPKPLVMEAIERYAEALRQWLTTQRGDLRSTLQAIELEMQYAVTGLDLLPVEPDAQRLRALESHLDAQFYQALGELQRLQAYLATKPAPYPGNAAPDFLESDLGLKPAPARLKVEAVHHRQAHPPA